MYLSIIPQTYRLYGCPLFVFFAHLSLWEFPSYLLHIFLMVNFVFFYLIYVQLL